MALACKMSSDTVPTVPRELGERAGRRRSEGTGGDGQEELTQ